jgi:hypothetical protein
MSPERSVTYVSGRSTDVQSSTYAGALCLIDSKIPLTEYSGVDRSIGRLKSLYLMPLARSLVISLVG